MSAREGEGDQAKARHAQALSHTHSHKETKPHTHPPTHTITHTHLCAPLEGGGFAGKDMTLLLVPVRDTGAEAGTMLTDVGTGPRELVLGATVSGYQE